ncbi:MULTISPECIES: (d)CMP kinase [Fusobacterium]|uniref:Cytidylate kinase n=1 Tax=Fusobacterium equinum TaxID=134605 RepID=A0A133NDK8_9FUSO|nr:MULTISPECIES: (d)CMP kinase [Fusobacterium]AVQ17013.1 (d)CMP kinase [Fusobacterium gonidiaformans ATCC 25563]EFS28861.1 cytidylate kinase [Fusobacterium gonidiaformans ATCC 25563]KXA14369.1 cytidylate kinase [Fusobacterium equinum]
MKEFIVALDGPAGSGKSTIAKRIAKQYHFTYVDTGAMYRMITWFFLENNVSWKEEIACQKALEQVHLDMKNERFFVNGQDVSEAIRGPRVSSYVSEIAALKVVRNQLVHLQRKIAKGKEVILDGRDIGTVVFPKANLKIFLLASAEERAKRRFLEYEEKGETISYEEVLKSIQERDYIDSTRKESPLRKAEDAIEIDSSTMTIEEVVAEVSKEIESKR